MTVPLTDEEREYLIATLKATLAVREAYDLHHWEPETQDIVNGILAKLQHPAVARGG